MHWAEVVARFKAVRHPAPDGSGAGEAWARFAAAVHENRASPPYHLKLLIERLDRFRGSRQPHEITLLDHGCGGALTLLYLAVLGYHDFHGVDIGGEFAPLNAVARRVFGHQSDRLHQFDGGRLPLADASCDFIFSQQVVEHVEDCLLRPYYAEAGRVLRPGGWAVHYVPHRLVPFDSHTKTWLLHYLPQPLYRAAARAVGRPVPGHLHLRWPWRHRALARRHIGPVVDVTAERLTALPDADRYDGPIGMRSAMARLTAAPGLGRIIRPVMSHFVMLETIAAKPDTRSAAPQPANAALPGDARLRH